jgi:hypothetical protein
MILLLSFFKIHTSAMRSLENMNIEFSIRKQINISITLVSESYAVLYYEKKSLFVIYEKNMFKSNSQWHTCEPFGGSIFLSILRVPSVPPVNFQNLPPVKKIKYQKILTYILRSIFLEIPHLELPRWRKTQRDTNGKGECHI